MSVTHETTIWCDGCAEWRQGCCRTRDLRRDLKSDGWSATRQDGKLKDYCPTCTADRRSKGLGSGGAP